jgi:hypothetical protein
MQADEISADLLIAEPVRRVVVKPTQSRDSIDIGLLGALRVTPKGQQPDVSDA